MTEPFDWNIYADAGYDNVTGKLSPYQSMQKMLVTRIITDHPNAKSLLDIGCGTGSFLMRCANELPQTTLFGLEPAASMLREAKKKCPAIVFHQGTASNSSMPFSPRTFEVMVSINVLYALSSEERRRELHAMISLLKEGGTLYVVVPKKGARIGPVFIQHIKQKGILSLIPLLPRIVSLGRYFKKIQQNAEGGTFHYFTKAELEELGLEVLGTTYADQNWFAKYQHRHPQEMEPQL
jgi:ubiquinone/menaquinone biosynthesis C-methylase UbiE